MNKVLTIEGVTEKIISRLETHVAFLCYEKACNIMVKIKLGQFVRIENV
jgi:hypothetical protein